MKISKQTFAILKNFININPSIIVTEGEPLKSITHSGNIIGIYDAEEVFPDFAIYDLSEFMSITGLFKLDETDFDFNKNKLTINDGKNQVDYFFTDPDLIPKSGNFEKVKPDVIKSLDGFDAQFSLPSSDIDKIQKASSIMGLEDLEIEMEDGEGTLILEDKNTPISNKFRIKIGDGEGTCNISVSVSNLQFISGDYSLAIKNKKFIKFQHGSTPLTYLVSAIIAK